MELPPFCYKRPLNVKTAKEKFATHNLPTSRRFSNTVTRYINCSPMMIQPRDKRSSHAIKQPATRSFRIPSPTLLGVATLFLRLALSLPLLEVPVDIPLSRSVVSRSPFPQDFSLNESRESAACHHDLARVTEGLGPHGKGERKGRKSEGSAHAR